MMAFLQRSFLISVALATIVSCFANCLSATQIGTSDEIVDRKESASSEITQDDRPNIVIIMADDLGFSDIGSYGGEIETPHLDQLAETGIRFSRFYNTSRCCPSRAALMTGRYQHSVDMGWMTAVDEQRPGYRGQLSSEYPTIAELLSNEGYQTFMSGKWHLTVDSNFKNNGGEPPNGSWPTQRGFQEFYGGLSGGGGYYRPDWLARNLERIPKQSLPDDYYYTTAITDHAIQFIEERDNSQPFLLYVAYYAPHRPLEAPADRVDACRERYTPGYDRLRRERFQRLQSLGMISDEIELGDTGRSLPSETPSWEKLDEARQARWVTEMATYAAMVEIMDDGIGEIVRTLQDEREFDNTLILFLSDNGATFEGGLISQLSADLSNTPFRNYKQFTHLGGVASPLIASWPNRFAEVEGELCHQPVHIMDIVPTCLELADVDYPSAFHGSEIDSPDGISLVPTFSASSLQARTFFWEHQTSRAVQAGDWRLVSLTDRREWELYNLSDDPFEQVNLKQAHPDKAAELEAAWVTWAEQNQVLPFERRPWTQRIEYYKNRQNE